MGAAKSQTRQSTHARTHEDSTLKRPSEDHQKDKSKQGGQEVADREVVQYGKPQPAGSLSTEAGSQCPGLQGKSPSCLCSTRDSLPSVAREAMHQNSSLRGCDTLCLLSRGMGGSLEALPPVLQAPVNSVWEICQLNPLSGFLLQVTGPVRWAPVLNLPENCPEAAAGSGIEESPQLGCGEPPIPETHPPTRDSMKEALRGHIQGHPPPPDTYMPFNFPAMSTVSTFMAFKPPLVGVSGTTALSSGQLSRSSRGDTSSHPL